MSVPGAAVVERSAARDGYLARFRAGEWRALIFRDIVLDEIAGRTGPQTVLDIGCGQGFDDDEGLQERIAAASGVYIGIEPDPVVTLKPYFDESYRCVLEDAPLRPSSVDVAFAVMVLEHLPNPPLFWDKLREALRDGGVFWGFTVDARHWFRRASAWSGRLGIKEFYLNQRLGRRGEAGRYENYPVHYRANTPSQVARDTGKFRSCETLNFSRVGQVNYYLPNLLKPLSDALDRRAIRRGKPGPLLAVRVVK